MIITSMATYYYIVKKSRPAPLWADSLVVVTSVRNNFKWSSNFSSLCLRWGVKLYDVRSPDQTGGSRRDRENRVLLSAVNMSGKTREESFVMWAVLIILIGTTILLSTHGVYRGYQVDNLEAELRELKLLVYKLQKSEEHVEIELQRTKRQVDLSSRPEVLDYAYNAKLPESTANLSVYSRWQSKPKLDTAGIANYHKVSAAWVGEDGEDRGNPEDWNNLMEQQNDQQYSHQFGVGEAFNSGESLQSNRESIQSNSLYQNHHR